jgi:N-acetylmuramoyl-L-alanine amidase
VRQSIRYSISFLLMLVILITIPVINASAAQQEGTVTANGSIKSKAFDTTIIVNGQKLGLEFEPPMENNRILVPFRAIGEALGIDVSWSQAEQKITANDIRQNKQVVFKINDVNTHINNQLVKLDAPPRLLQNRTMLPLRFFAETFGAEVNWNQATKTATITRGLKIAEVVEEVKSSTPVQLAGLSATVTANTLNVRSGPNTSTGIVDKLLKHQSVNVIDFEAEWLKVEYGGIIGYVHSGYLELFNEYGQKVKGLVSASSEVQGQQRILSWSKIAGPSIASKLVGNSLTITTDAALVEQIDLQNEAIERIRYQDRASGVELTIAIREGYTASVHDTLGKVTISFFKKGEKGKRIVLDGGHGGKDPGAVANGLQEKEINLDVSLRVKKLLETAGVEVIMTRTNDTFLELAKRVEIANIHKADAFVSIHANAAANVNVNGTETFWNSTHSSAESKKLAQHIQAQLLQKLGTNDRGVKEANFHVIRNATMPSVLVELGFMTNKKEATQLASNDFRQKSAEAIFQGIMEFYK